MSDFYPQGWGNPPEQRIWVYAGFWMRVWAALVDHFLLLVIDTVLAMVLTPHFSFSWMHHHPDTQALSVAYIPDMQPDMRDVSLLYPRLSGPFDRHTTLLLSLVPAIYFIVLEASWLRGTFGKRLFGLQVTDLAGGQIGLTRALVRFVVKVFVSFPFLLLGVLIIPFTRRKQALHDMVAGTLVVRSDRASTIAFRR